jgi:hypothetical protein
MRVERIGPGVWVIAFLAAICAGCSTGEEYARPPTATHPCHFTSEPIVIDGNLDEAAWQAAPVLKFLVAGTEDEPLSPTEGRMLWDGAYLYVGFKAYDKDIWSYFTERDSVTCWEDVLETFIKPDEDKDAYYNFEINAVGTAYDAFNVKRKAGGGDSHRWRRWNCEGLKVGIKTVGTLNDWHDADDYWTMEVAVPFTELPTLEGRAPDAGDVWLFHLARYDYSVHLPEGVELSSCVRLSQVNFHLYEDWMRLRFVR